MGYVRAMEKMAGYRGMAVLDTSLMVSISLVMGIRPGLDEKVAQSISMDGRAQPSINPSSCWAMNLDLIQH